MPRTKEQFNQMRQERLEALLDSSLVLFALYGDDFTVDQVAELSHCSHGIVYHYFKNTEEISAKLMNSRKFNEFRNTIIKSYKSVIAKEAIYFIVKEMIDVNTKHDICYAKILINEDGKNSLRQLLNGLVERGQKEGDVAGGDPNDITNCFFYLLDGYYSSMLIRKKVRHQKPSFDNTVELFKKKR